MDTQDWYIKLLSLYFNQTDGELEISPDDDLLEELLEAINDVRPSLGTDQYLS